MIALKKLIVVAMSIKEIAAESKGFNIYQVESEKMKSFSGSCIGLYICAKIVERHCGHIWAESEEETKFSFTLSLANNQKIP